MALRTEDDLVRSLSGTYTVQELYRLAEEHGLPDRPGGRDRTQDGNLQYKRRIRSALQHLRVKGKAARVENADRATWVIEGTRERPRRALFVWLPADPTELEIVLGEATEVLARCDDPIDLVLADPPYALRRGGSDASYRDYGRRRDSVVGGYVDIDPGEYAEFTASWISAAHKALRPGGYLAVVTGPQQAARLQVAAEDAGMTYVNSIAVARQFGMFTRRRFVHQHHVITLMTNGTLRAANRTFHRPEEMPRGRSGEIYAADIWTDIPDPRRPGLLRYDNALPVQLCSRVIRSTTNHGELVADPFLGSGTTAVACLETGRRFYGGDVNPESIRFTQARILDEAVPALNNAHHRPAPASGPTYTYTTIDDLLTELETL
jgi:DNA modification methylase